MAKKFTMKETTVSNEIDYVIVLKGGIQQTIKSRVEAYKEFERLKKYNLKGLVLKKITTNVETEYLERG